MRTGCVTVSRNSFAFLEVAPPVMKIIRWACSGAMRRTFVVAFAHDFTAEIERLSAAEDPLSGSRMKPARCIDLKRAHIEAGIVTKEDCGALLDHLAYIAEPSTGAPTMLLVFARMATTACVWLDGDLRIELRRDRETIWIDAMTELGGGMGERVFPSIAVHVPFDEFLGAVERLPRLCAGPSHDLEPDPRPALATARSATPIAGPHRPDRDIEFSYPLSQTR